MPYTISLKLVKMSSNTYSLKKELFVKENFAEFIFAILYMCFAEYIFANRVHFLYVVIENCWVFKNC